MALGMGTSESAGRWSGCLQSGVAQAGGEEMCVLGSLRAWPCLTLRLAVSGDGEMGPAVLLEGCLCAGSAHQGAWVGRTHTCLAT